MTDSLIPPLRKKSGTPALLVYTKEDILAPVATSHDFSLTHLWAVLAANQEVRNHHSNPLG